MRSRITRSLGGLCLLLAISGSGSAEESAHRAPNPSGPLLMVGPAELESVMYSWSEDVRGHVPGLQMRVQASDSSTALNLLAQGLAHLALTSRAMNRGELDTFVSRTGHRPTPLRIGLDAVRILVHRDNPVPGLTLAEVSAIFSGDRRCGAEASIDDWGKLTSMSLWHSRPIHLFGSAADADLQTYFREHVLCNGAFKANMQALSHSQTLLRAIGDSQNAIGFANLAGQNEQVRAIQLSQRTGGPYFEPSPANVLSGAYPLSHYLYIYFDKVPQLTLPPSVKKTLSLILSPQGQARLAQAARVALPPTSATEEARKLE